MMNEQTVTKDNVRDVYLDHAATTPLCSGALSKMLPYMRTSYGNPSSLHPMGSSARNAVEKARQCIIELIRGEGGNLFFTSGGTEANNWAISGVVEAQNIRHIITSPLEHSSVIATVGAWQTKGINCKYVPTDTEGGLDYEGLKLLLQRCPRALVSLMHANNEVGNITDIARVASLCKKHGAILHSDIVQTVGFYPLDVARWGIDLCTGSAHKFYGPKGTGFLYVGEGVQISPWLYGGKQERGLRGGTEDVAGIIGMSSALTAIQANKETYKAHIQSIKAYMVEKLLQHIPDVRFHGQCKDSKTSLCTILNVGLPHADKETLLLQLAIKGIAASSGSACMSGSKLSSHVLHALKVPDEEANVRFSFGIQNTHEEIDHAIHALLASINR